MLLCSAVLPLAAAFLTAALDHTEISRETTDHALYSLQATPHTKALRYLRTGCGDGEWQGTSNRRRPPEQVSVVGREKEGTPGQQRQVH